MPLGLFTILGPSFQNPKAFSWHNKLTEYKSKVEYALSSFSNADLTSPMKQRGRKMLSITSDFVSQVLRQKSVTIEEYSSYTAKMLPFIKENLDDSAKMQIDAVMEAISKWKEELGPESWRNLYVVIPTVWPVSKESPREQIFLRLMEPEEVDNHLIIGEGIKTIDEARTLLGRIVVDRAVGRLVFTISNERNRALTQALSSQKDVVANSARKAILELEQRSYSSPK